MPSTKHSTPPKVELAHQLFFRSTQSLDSDRVVTIEDSAAWQPELILTWFKKSILI